MIATVKNGRAQIRNDNGSLLRTVGSSGAISASISPDDEYVAVTYENGKVELRKANGSLIRTITNKDATGATFAGGTIAIQKTNGRTEIRKVPSGSRIRTI